MRTLSLFALAVAVVSVASAFQVRLPARSAYERRGLYHASIRGQIVSPSGKPVSGVHIQLNAGRPRSLPLADVVAGSDGRFTLSGVNSIYPPYLTWLPPEEWLEGGTSVVGESAADIDVGVIQLQPAATVRVAVELVGGVPRAPGESAPTVVLIGEPGWPRIAAETIGSEQIIRGISFENGSWEVSLSTGSRSEVYTAPYHLPRGGRDRKFTFRLLRDTVRPASEYHSEGRMEVSLSTAPVTNFARDFQVSGRIAGPDGSPVEGAIVSTFRLTTGSSMVQWARSDSHGSFDLKYTSTKCIEPSVSYGDSDYWNLYYSKPSLRELTCEDWLQTTQTIAMPTPSRLAIRVSGLDPAKVRAAWWHDSFGWQTFASLHPWLPAGDLWRAAIRADAAGYLPLTQKLKVPYFDRSEAAPPAELPLAFQFDSKVRRTLAVKSAGKPLAGAIVDVESVVNLDTDERRLLNAYTLPADGSLQLLGGGDQVVEAFIYAEGFEPRRVIWNPGVPLVVDMISRSSTFEFPASSSTVAARIREAGSPRTVRTVVLSGERHTVARVAPGTYDVTCYNARGALAGYQRLKVDRATVRVDCSVDQRPRLTVRRPDDGWRLTVSQATPPGRATQWVVMSLAPGRPGFSEVGFTVLQESRTELILALSHAGKWHVEAQERDRTLSLWRDVDLRPGESMTVGLPMKSGALKGSMRTYDGGLRGSTHGFAGPRLQLIADDPGGWSVTEDMPRRDSREGEEKHRFTLSGIPAGRYHLFQHLIGEQKTYTGGNSTRTYNTPVAAWGGIPVQIAANSATVLKDFGEFPVSDLQVRVTDARGRPVEHATLRIRDRMSESWRQVEENPAQLEEAAHPIPYPAAARIAGGRATLPRIREGRLDLAIELDSGAVFQFTLPVSPERKLSLRLPPEKH